MLIKYNILSKMSSIYDLKIFIQSNPKQELAAKVSSFSFKKYGFKNVEILRLNNVIELKNNLNNTYFRGGKKIVYNLNDLQSFTLLRFLPPKIHDDFCLIIDPDVFVVKDPAHILKNYLNKQKKKLLCTQMGNKFKSEVCMINCKNFDLWDFDKIVQDLFNKKIDYQNIINFNFIDQAEIGILDESLNSLDAINDKTFLLHTTNRLTQPWKEGLDIDFKVHISKINYIKNFINKIMGRQYNSKIFEKKYKLHPNQNVLNFVEHTFKEAYVQKFITEDEIKLAIQNKHLSSKFIKRLNL